jgi:hypothetical protein
VGNLAEVQNPKAGDSVTSACGTIKVTLKDDGILPVSLLSKRRFVQYPVVLRRDN